VVCRVVAARAHTPRPAHFLQASAACCSLCLELKLAIPCTALSVNANTTTTPGCSGCVHALCSGDFTHEEVPPEKERSAWRCAPCYQGVPSDVPTVCAVCSRDSAWGMMKETTRGNWAHLVCSLALPDVTCLRMDGYVCVQRSTTADCCDTWLCCLADSGSYCQLLLLSYCYLLDRWYQEATQLAGALYTASA
jgi:hypothetical protein